MSSVRTRIEDALMASRYLAQSAPKITQQAEDERRERLAQNFRRIQEDRLNVILLDASDDERSTVNDIVNRNRPNCLGNPDVISATLLLVRTEGVENLREVMQGTTKEEQHLVWEILKDSSPAARLGMDGGRACREALQDVRHKQFMEE
jgi:hypothetical protein